ncbi:MAG: hypothetical protein WCX59_05250 [Anaerovoracaceae bacterium]|jgi:hypothetical protein
MFWTILKSTFLITGGVLLVVILGVYALILYIFVSVSYSTGTSMTEFVRRFKEGIQSHLLEIIIFVMILFVISYLVWRALS